MFDNITRMPGVHTERTYTPINIFWAPEGKLWAPGGTIDGAQSRDPQNPLRSDELRAGLLMGLITASGKWRPSIVGLSKALYEDDDLAIAVDEVTATEIARLKALQSGDLEMYFIGPPTAGGVVAVTEIAVSAVTIDGASSTLTVADLGLNKVAGSILALRDGSHIPRSIFAGPGPVRVTDPETLANIDVPFSSPLIGGMIDVSKIINYPSDVALQAWLKAQIRLSAPGLVFSDDFQV